MHCFSFRSFSFPLLSSLNAPRFGLIIHRSSSFQLKWKWKWKEKIIHTHSNAVRVCNLLLPRSIHISFHIFHHTNLTRLKEHDPYFQWLCILCILDFNAYIFHFLDVYLFMLLTLLLLFYFLFFHIMIVSIATVTAKCIHRFSAKCIHPFSLFKDISYIKRIYHICT